MIITDPFVDAPFVTRKFVHAFEVRCVMNPNNSIANSIAKMMVLSCVFGSVFSFLGLAISYEMNIPGGPSIILITAFCFFLLYPWSQKKMKRKKITDCKF